METHFTLSLGLIMAAITAISTWASIKLTGINNSKNIEKLDTAIQDMDEKVDIGFKELDNKIAELKDSQHKMELQTARDINNLSIALTKISVVLEKIGDKK